MQARWSVETTCGGRLRGASVIAIIVFFFNDPATTEIYTLSLHDALPISSWRRPCGGCPGCWTRRGPRCIGRSEEHTSELQSRLHLVCRLLLEKKKSSSSSASSTTRFDSSRL